MAKIQKCNTTRSVCCIFAQLYFHTRRFVLYILFSQNSSCTKKQTQLKIGLWQKYKMQHTTECRSATKSSLRKMFCSDERKNVSWQSRVLSPQEHCAACITIQKSAAVRLASKKPLPKRDFVRLSCRCHRHKPFTCGGRSEVWHSAIPRPACGSPASSGAIR